MDEPPSPFEWALAGRPIAFLLAESVGYFALLVAARRAGREGTAAKIVDAVAARLAFGRRSPSGRPLFEGNDERGKDADEDSDEDEDVAAERAVVRRGASEKKRSASSSTNSSRRTRRRARDAVVLSRRRADPSRWIV